MVFSSIPTYIDPSLWQQQQQQQNQLQEHQQQQLNHPTGAAQAAAAAAGSNNNFTNPLLLTPPQPPTHHHTQPHHVGVSSAPPLLRPPTTSIRPGSMSERARMANIPPPGRQLNCPRCHSTDTKFCYYNNYSLSQPRHFCKGCRRYWTHGGAMRNVPVGGCRRNNHSKRSSSKGSGSTSSNSKSSQATSDRSSGSTSSAAAVAATSGGGTVSRMADILGLNVPQMIPSTLRFMTMAPLHHHFASDNNQFGVGNSTGFGAAELGLSGYHGGISGPMPSINAGSQMAGLQAHQLGSNMIGAEQQWRMQPPTPPPPSFPLFGGMDASTSTNNNLYPFEGMELSRLGVAVRPNIMSLDSRDQTRSAGADRVIEEMKMNEIISRHRHPSAHHQRQHEMDQMNLTRQFNLGMNELGGGGGQNQYGSWADGSGTTGGVGGVSDAWTSSSTVVHMTNTDATDLSGLNSSSSTTGAM